MNTPEPAAAAAPPAAIDNEPLPYDVQLAGTLIEVVGALELHGDTPVLRVKHLRPR